MIGREEHDLHRRRRGRNMAVGVLLIGLVALLFGVTIAKLGVNVIKPEMSWSEAR